MFATASEYIHMGNVIAGKVNENGAIEASRFGPYSRLAIGVALRDISAGECISFSPAENTRDVMNSGNIDTALSKLYLGLMPYWQNTSSD